MGKLGFEVAVALALMTALVAPPKAVASTADRQDDPPPTIVMKVPKSALAQYNDWRDVPHTPGAWTYTSDGTATVATFGAPSAEAQFQVRCNLTSKQVTLARLGVIGAKGDRMTIWTEANKLTLETETPNRKVFETLSYLEASDHLLDDLAVPTGRFGVKIAFMWLNLPGSPEIGNVVEDCRRSV